MTTTPLPPLDWVAMLKDAIGIVKDKPTYKRFIDGTPLDNDVPVWMADFAMLHATQARADLEAENKRLREALDRYQFIRRHSYVLRVFVNGTHGELMQPSPGHLPDEDFDAEIDKLRAALENTK